MCDPTIAIAATVLSTAVGAFGQIQAGNAQAAEAKYQSQIAANNAKIMSQEAGDARRRAQVDEENARIRQQQLQGRQRAVMGAQGVDMSSGNALDILSDTAAFGEMDALQTRENGEREARAAEIKGANFTADAQLGRMRAKSASQAGMIGAAGTVLSGVGSVSEKWYKMKVA